MASDSANVFCAIKTFKGEVSCDIVVIQHGELYYNFVACNSGTDVVLKCSPWYAIENIPDISALDISIIIHWANSRYKYMNIKRNIEVTDPTTGELADLNTTLMATANFIKMHPSGLPDNPNTTVIKVLASVDPDNSIVKLGSPVPNQAILAAWVSHRRIIDGSFQSVEIPCPCCIEGGKTLNSTIMLIGEEFKKSFLDCSYQDTVDDAVLSYSAFIPFPPRIHGLFGNSGDYTTPTSPEDRYGLRNCRLIYLCPDDIMHTRGFHTAVGDRANTGRVSISSAGVVLKDHTRQRLITSGEHSCILVPYVCGCVVRNALRFPRAHIPLIINFGVKHTVEFSDDPECDTSILLTVHDYSSDSRTFRINTQERTSFYGLLWLEMTEI